MKSGVRELVGGKYVDAGSAGAGTGLTGPDWASMGLQVAGGMMSDQEAEEERKRLEEMERLAKILGQRDRRDIAEQNVISEQQTDRSMNMAGANVLTEMRQNAMKNRRLYSTRKAFSGAM